MCFTSKVQIEICPDEDKPHLEILSLLFRSKEKEEPEIAVLVKDFMEMTQLAKHPSIHEGCQPDDDIILRDEKRFRDRFGILRESVGRMVFYE